ncbi:ATP-binding protein [Halobacillus salinus]|uniref:ATP-binding protein n=1 Tax=Halobacillus salinus TaxID=192814 RepID=UPI0015928061|nr:AAA family ATPase [Halobacillus salinus]
MKIVKATVYGFGKWKNESFHFDIKGMTAVTGKNEAGKSTLQQFLLYMLFGLPPKQRAFFKPKTGGPVGGQLIVEIDSLGEVIIERVEDIRSGEAVCKLPSGDEMGEEWLLDRLKGTNREMFHSIFSFSAQDLLDIHQLSGHELGEVLLNIGLTGSDYIYQTERWLEKNAMDRFKPKGKKPLLNQQLERVEQLAKEQSEKEKEIQKYEGLKEKQYTLERQIEDNTGQMSHLRQELSRSEQLHKALPVLNEYHQKRVAGIKSVPFPENGSIRYQQVKEAILPLQSQANLIENTLQKVRGERQSLEAEQVDESVLKEGEHWLLAQSSYDHMCREMESLENRALRLQEQIEQELIQLDLGIKKEELTNYSLPFYAEDTWRSLQEESKTLQAEEEQLSDEWRKLRAHQERLSNQIAAIESNMLSDQELEDATRAVDHAFSQSSRKRSNSKSQQKKVRLIAASSLLLLVMGWLFTSITDMVGGIFTLVGIGLAAYALWVLTKSASPSDETAVHSIELDEYRRKLNTYDQQKSEWSHLQDQWKMANHEDIQLEERRNHMIQKGKRLESRLSEQEQLYPFLTKVSIEHWGQLFRLFSQAQEKQSEWEQVQADLQTRRMEIDRLNSGLKAFYHVNKWEWNQKKMSDAFEQVRKWVADQKEIHNQLKRLRQQEGEEQQRQSELQIQLETLEDERLDLFEKAEVTDEESFYHQLTKYEKHKANIEAADDLKRQLNRMLSEDEQTNFGVWNESIDESKVKVKIEELTQDRERVEESLLYHQQELADCKSQLAVLESSEDLSRSLHHLEAERNTLNEQAREWAVYQVALNLLQQTKTKYKERYLPEVIMSAARYFSRLTSYQYREVRLSHESETLIVEHENRQRYTVEELSRGTQDQLYISIRLALGELMSTTISLPFIIDDAFVNFDEDRQDEMFAILHELSYDHQVIFMTWRTESPRFIDRVSIQHLS